MFITTLNIPFIGVAKRLLLFSLSGLSCDVFNRHALPGVNHYTLRQGPNPRQIQNANKVVINVKPLRFVFACALRLMNSNFFDQLVDDHRGQLLNIGVPLYRQQKAGRALLYGLLVQASLGHLD